MSDITTEIAAAAHLKALGGTIHQHGDRQAILVIPASNGASHAIDLERFYAQPTRIRSSVNLLSRVSLEDYIKTYKDKQHPVVLFANYAALSLTAILDYHGHPAESAEDAVNPSWCTHRAGFTYKTSVALTKWREAATHTKKWKQADLANFLEEHEEDILPGAAGQPSMHTVIDGIRATRTESFATHRDRDNGNVDLVYKATTEAKGDQTVTIPREFHIAVPIYERQPEAIRFRVLLQHEMIKETGLVFTMKIMNVDRIIEAQWNLELEALKAVLGDTAQVLEGAAPVVQPRGGV